MTDTQLALREAAPLTFSNDQIQLIKDTYAKGASDQEFYLYLEIAKHNRLDPFKNQIYLIGRWDSELGRKVFKPMTSIEGLRAKAAETGIPFTTQIQWCGKDRKWLDVWLDTVPPEAARCLLYRPDVKEPTSRVVNYKSYVSTKKDGTPNVIWKKFPESQLGKCAEAAALRSTFPDQCAGMYVGEEMEQAGYKPAEWINEETGEVTQAQPARKPAPAVKANPKLQEILFPGLTAWPPQNDKGYAIGIGTAGKLTAKCSDPFRGKVRGEFAAKGYGSDEDRRALMGKLYSVFGIAKEDRHTTSNPKFSTGHGFFFMNILQHENFQIKETDDPPPWEVSKEDASEVVEGELVDDLEVIDLEEDEDYLINPDPEQ